MKLLADTSALIEFLSGNKNVKEIFENADEIFVSSLSVFELLAGRVKNKEIEEFVTIFNVIPFSKSDAIIASKLYKDLKNKGMMINLVDIFIASQAKNKELKILTKDKDFLKIDGISVELINSK